MLIVYNIYPKTFISLDIKAPTLGLSLDEFSSRAWLDLRPTEGFGFRVSGFRV